MNITFDIDGMSQFDDDESKEAVRHIQQKKLEFDRLLSGKITAKCESLETHRQKLVGELEQAQQENRQLGAEQSNLYIGNAGIDDDVKNSFRNLREYKRDYTPDPRFALPRDIKQFDETVAELESRHNEANRAQREYNDNVGSWRGRMTASNEKVAALEDQITLIWRTIRILQGLPVPRQHSRETGLPVVDGEEQMQKVPVGVTPVGPFPRLGI